MIVGVAIKINCFIYSLPKPNRHHHLFQISEVKEHRNNLKGQKREEIQGFITDLGVFLDREEAAEHVFINKQKILNRDKDGKINGFRTTLNWPPDLYSEDLW